MYLIVDAHTVVLPGLDGARFREILQGGKQAGGVSERASALSLRDRNLETT